MCVCVSVCVCVCVSTPEAINNWWHDMDPKRLVNKFYSCHMAIAVAISNGCGLSLLASYKVFNFIVVFNTVCYGYLRSNFRRFCRFLIHGNLCCFITYVIVIKHPWALYLLCKRDARGWSVNKLHTNWMDVLQLLCLWCVSGSKARTFESTNQLATSIYMHEASSESWVIACVWFWNDRPLG